MSFNIFSKSTRVLQSYIEDNRALHCRRQIIIYLFGITGPSLSPPLLWALCRAPGPRWAQQDGIHLSLLPLAAAGPIQEDKCPGRGLWQFPRQGQQPGQREAGPGAARAPLALQLSSSSPAMCQDMFGTNQKLLLNILVYFVSGGSDASCKTELRAWQSCLMLQPYLNSI